MGSLSFNNIAIIALIPLVFYGIVLWILWKFYHAFARIGEELSEIKTILQERVTRPETPPA
jgi:flagellar biogenesis protein FliO